MNRLKIANFVNGEWCQARSGQVLEVRNPATGQVYAEAPDSDAIDSILAVQAANKAFAKWSETPVRERAESLLKIADRLEARIEDFARAESRDVGKPYWLALEADLPRAIQCFRFFAGLVQTSTSMAAGIEGRAIQYTRREPLGVCALITPWNFPLYTLSFKIAPCLAMGNVAVCKPSELTPVTAFMLAEVMAEVGLPAGVCNFIFGRGETAGAALVQHPGVPLISFTGGTSTGEKIQKVAAPLFKRVSLELGGKNANVVLNDADLKRAVPMAVRASFVNSGQVCLAGSRLMVQDGVYDEFMSEFLKATREFKVGDPQEPATMMGPLVSEAQRDRVEAAVREAVSEKGRVLCGGRAPEGLPEGIRGGYFYEPTVVEDLTNCSEIWQREIFGPFVTTLRFKYAHEAVKWANTSPYGLSASIWTQNIDRAHKLAAQIGVGTVWVNTWSLRDPRVPFGGYKSSGIGREGGEDSLRTYSETKTVCIALS
jgi:aminomuconate-semialdehyde/2-hydroxymuconate-6-semialdehyde dehydrogenase